MAVSTNFASSALDLDGKTSLSAPTALVWGPDGRLYVTELDGLVKAMTVTFGDKPGDGDGKAEFHVTDVEVLSQVKTIPNHDDDGAPATGKHSDDRQVTGIDAVRQFDANGEPVTIDGQPAVTLYVTSTDRRHGAGGKANGADSDLDTNSGVITRLTQTADGWEVVDLVRGLTRSEENHSLNGLEVIQELDEDGNLVSERMIVSTGGNANTGAPSRNFAGQQEQPLSAALLEVDLTALSEMDVQTDPASGRAYVYDLPTLDDPTRDGAAENDPWGGNDGFNSAKLTADGPVRMYSPGYRNAYDVEVTDDGRVWTYDNGANNKWGGRPVGEAGDDGGSIDFAQAAGYIATNLNNGDGNNNDPINLEDWNPKNKDQLHEATRSDDLEGRALSAGQGGEQTYSDGTYTYVYGGHPNPTRAEGSRAGLLWTPGDTTEDAFLLVSSEDSFGDGNGLSDYEEVIAWLAEIEGDHPVDGLYGVAQGGLTGRVLAVEPGVLYDVYAVGSGGVAVPAGGDAPEGGRLVGQAGLPSDIAEIVHAPNPIEGDYLEAGKTDGALDSGTGSINGLAEYTSSVLDGDGIAMKGALIGASLNGGSLIVMGRGADGVMASTVKNGFAVAAERGVIDATGAPLGLAAIGDDHAAMGLGEAFRGSIWTAVYSGSGIKIEVFQPANGAVPLAGSEAASPTDADADGIDHVADPFELSFENGYGLRAGESLVLDFDQNKADDFPGTVSTGLLGAALDGTTPNRDAWTATENYGPDQQRDGLYNNGENLIPGANAPTFQIKKVVDGTMVGAANSARDAMHTGVRLGADADRMTATLDVVNWIPEAGGALTGQLTGLVLGDGTQSNFVRVVFGGVADTGLGFEVGIETGDDYAVLARAAVPGLVQSSAAAVELRLEVSGIGTTFQLEASYRLSGEDGFTTLATAALPQGVLRDVLTGAHEIGGKTSGAAVGLVAEDTGGDGKTLGGEDEGLLAVDFNSLVIEAHDDDASSEAGRELFALDFETGADPLLEGGFDTALGGEGAIEAGKISMADGKLVVQTSQGDLSESPATASKNDLVRAADVSSAAIEELVLSTRFANPFDAAFLAAHGEDGSIPSYLQQGIVVAAGDAAANQDADHFVKVIWGGVPSTGIQLWSQDAISQKVLLGDIAAAAGGSFSTADVASVALELVIDKAAGTIAAVADLYDAAGALLGGVRPTAEAGFAVIGAQAIPAPVAAALADGTSVFGVTSTDFDGNADKLGSFPATWDHLTLSSPQVSEGVVDRLDGASLGDLSDEHDAPTELGTLRLGATTLEATQQGPGEQGGRDYDYVTFTVAEGQVLKALVLEGFEAATGTNAGFLGLIEGASMPAPPASAAEHAALAAKLLGGTLMSGNDGAQEGDDLLGADWLASGDVQGQSTMTFDAPLGAGVYTLWFSQGGGASTATLRFETEAPDAPVVIDLSGAATVAEAGDEGTTTLEFGVGAPVGFTGAVTLDYTVGGVAAQQVVSVTDSAGILEVAVANDDADTGDRTIEVVLTGASLEGGPAAIGQATATGVVTEDDGAPAGAGDVVFALNVGGGEVVGTDGVVYAADDGAGWKGSKTYADGGVPSKDAKLAGGDYDRDGDADADDAPFGTERYGGKPGAQPMTYTKTGLEPGEYVLTLMVAENFDPNFEPGKRVFDVSVNGALALDDLDLTTRTTGPDHGIAIDLPVTVGEDGILFLSFAASADNGKLNALVLREAPTNAAPTTQPIDAGSAPETADPVAIDLLAGAQDADADALAVQNVSVKDAGGYDVAFAIEGSVVTIDPAQLADYLDEGETLAVTVTYEVSDGQAATPGTATLVVEGVDDGLVWHRDADGDGWGSDADTVVAAEAPEGYVAQGGDADDANAAIHPGAPEVNDGLDNDQDGATDEDNAAPVAVDDAGYEVASGASLAVAAAELLADDTDADGDALSIISVDGGADGTASIEGGVVTFTPADGFTGQTSFTYTVSDGFGGTATGTVSVEVAEAGGVVETPLPLGGAVASYGVDLGSKGQDRTGAEGAAVEGASVTMKGNAWKSIALGQTVAIAEGTTLRFDYASDKIAEIVGIGLDSDDAVGNAASAVFQIAGTQTLKEADQSHRGYEAGEVRSYEIDLSAFAGQSFDRLVLIHDQDRNPASSEGVFSDIRLAKPAGANVAPQAGADEVSTVAGQALAIPAADLLADDTDADGDALSVIAVSDPAGGTVALEGGVVTFTPADGFTGQAGFDYAVSDGRGGVSTARVSVEVRDPSETAVEIDFSASPVTSYDDQDVSPGAGAAVSGDGAALTLTGNAWKKIALPSGAAITEDTVLRFDLTLREAGEILAIGLETDDAFRSAGDAIFQLAGRQNFGGQSSREHFGLAQKNQTVRYEIELGEHAGAGFTHLVLIGDDDAKSAVDATFSDVALVERGAGGGTQAPVIFGGALPDQTVAEDAPFEFELPIVDADTPREELRFEFTGLPEFVQTEGGMLTGTADDADVGAHVIGVTAIDLEGNQVSGSFTLTVENVNDAPEATGTMADRGAVLGAEVSIPLPQGLFADADGDALSYAAEGLPSGLAIDAATGAITGTPAASGAFEVKIVASDGQATAEVAFTLDVAAAAPREEIVIEAEDFTGLASSPFYGEFVSNASGMSGIRLKSKATGAVETDLAAAGLAPGAYDLAVRVFDESDGASTLRVLVDRGEGEPELLGAFALDAALPGQGNATQAANLRELALEGVTIGAGDRLVLEGAADGGEYVRVDLVRFTPVENAAPAFSSPASFSAAEDQTAVGIVAAADPEGGAVTYAVAGGADADLFAVDAATGALSFLAAPDFEAPADQGGDNAYEVIVEASDGAAASAQAITVTVTDEDEAPNPFGAVRPGDDLDGDGQANASDDDVDGDDVADADDAFAYDAGNGRLLAAGESVALDFGIDGTPWENGFTGLLQGGVKNSDAVFGHDEDTGTARVENGRLIVTASNGDTGGSNDPEDDYQLGIRNGAFTVEARVENPFLTHTAANHDQIGIHVGLDSTDFVKLVFGFKDGVVEFSAQTNDAEQKATGGNQPLPLGLSEFAAVDLSLAVESLSATQAELTAKATFLDAAGQPIAGATDVSFASLTVGGKLAAALADETKGVGAGVTQTQVNGPDKPFEAVYDRFAVTAKDAGDGGTGGAGGEAPESAAEAFAAQSDLFTGASYADGAVGSAKLEVMAGVNDIDASNYKKGSFEVTNTGDKKIAAVFIDVTGALYPDSVFDPDGLGGDDAAKPWGIDFDGGTGAYVTGSGYFLPGPDPIPNPQGAGGPVNGGYRGAMVKFGQGTFEAGESVGFSGDMDPNSIAGMGKNGPASILAGATKGWDVGGVSGHEMIGSRFTVLFDDGTTATGQLGSDGSDSGSHALATQAAGPAAPTITVNGVAAGGLGTYGVDVPTVLVTGEAGQTVRVTLTKGHDPVNNATNGVDQTVADRLEAYDFEVSNNFDSQTVDVTLDATGKADLSDLFDYSKAAANEKGSFPGDDTAPIGFVAAVVDPATGLPLSGVTRPVYLTNDGGPVNGGGDSGGGDGGSGGEAPEDGYWLAADGKLKVQFEDVLGTTPPNGWTREEPGQGNSGAQGAHYFWGSEADSTALNGAPNSGKFSLTIYVEEAGAYNLRIRSSRDSNNPSDARNDIWVKVDDGVGSVLDYAGSSSLLQKQGYAKLFGANKGWGYAQTFDSQGHGNPKIPAKVELSEGFHTIEFAGRSEGFHIDWFELSKGGQLVGAPSSKFVEGSEPPTDDGDGDGGDTGGGAVTGTIEIPVDASSDDWETFGGAGSKDLELGFNGSTPQSVGVRFTDVDIPEGAVIERAFIRFEAMEDAGGQASFLVAIEDDETASTYSAGSAPDDRDHADEIVWNTGAWSDGDTYETADLKGLIEAVVGQDGVEDGALAFRLSNAPGNEGARAAHSWDSSGEEPVLVIEFADDSPL